MKRSVNYNSRVHMERASNPLSGKNGRSRLSRARLASLVRALAMTLALAVVAVVPAGHAGSTGPTGDDARAEDLAVVEIEPSAIGGEADSAAASSRLSVETSDCDQISRIEIWKRHRALVAHCAHGGGVAMRVALGREEGGPKRAGRDNRTPEGYYHVAGPARRSQKFHLFLPIDYPSRADAELGLALGTIDEPTYERIVDALEDGRVPPQNTPLGGHVGLHGEGERWKGDSVSINWTYGCIALDDDQIEFLAERAPAGTPVIIRP